MDRQIENPRSTLRGAVTSCAIAALCLVLAACEERPLPRTFADFMEDPIAREGALSRCNENQEATLNDIECANARRATSAIALRQERERREVLERESERKLEELKREMADRERIAREAALEAARAEREAYEALWREREGLVNAATPRQPEPPRDQLELIELPLGLKRD